MSIALPAHLDPHVHSALAAATVYGPVPSRRYGTTLGLNLLPEGEKRCSLRCTYCQLGPETKPNREVTFPTLAQLEAEVSAALDAWPHVQAATGLRLDAMVLSGNGESTLHPDFPAAVALLRSLRDRKAPGTPLVLLTAGTELTDPDVLAACQTLDEVAVKLDAGTQRTYQRLDMPWTPLPVGTVPQAAAGLTNAVAQTLLVQGSVDNTGPAEIEAWLDLVRQMKPRRVDLYTLSRDPIEKALKPADPAVMQAIGKRVVAQTGLEVRVFAEGLND